MIANSFKKCLIELKLESLFLTPTNLLVSSPPFNSSTKLCLKLWELLSIHRFRIKDSNIWRFWSKQITTNTKALIVLMYWYFKLETNPFWQYIRYGCKHQRKRGYWTSYSPKWRGDKLACCYHLTLGLIGS